MNEDWIRKINDLIATKEYKEILSETVIEVRGKRLDEFTLLKEELQRWSVVRYGNRDITISGLGNPHVQEMIIAAIADFKEQNHSGRFIKPLHLATIDDLVVMPLRPEVFGLSKYYISGLSANSQVNIIPQEGQAAGTAGIGEVTSDGYFQIDPKVARIIYTDFIEYNPAGIITAIKANIDDRSIFPFEMRYQMKSEIPMFTLPSIEIQRIKSKWVAKAEFNGDTELTPVGVVVTLGEKVPNLVIS